MNAITSQSNSTAVRMVEYEIDSNGKIISEPKDLRDRKDPQNVEMNTLLTSLLKGNPKITKKSQQLLSEYNKPMVHYDLTKGDKTYSISIEMKDMTKENTAIVQSFGKSLGAINKETRTLAESFAASVAQKDVRVRYNKGHDLSDAGLLQYTRTANGSQPRVMQQMNKGPKKDGGINIIANKKGFQLVSTVNGLDLPLTESELLSSIKFDFDQELNDDQWATYIIDFLANNPLKEYLIDRIGEVTRDSKQPNLPLQDIMGILSQSEQAYTAKSKAKLLKVIKS